MYFEMSNMSNLMSNYYSVSPALHQIINLWLCVSRVCLSKWELDEGGLGMCNSGACFLCVHSRTVVFTKTTHPSYWKNKDGLYFTVYSFSPQS